MGKTTTPGILAGKVEKHDEVTKEALKQCDLIVYVVTSQLFDDIIFENFIDLAYGQHLKDKMLVAINKMSMENGDFNTLTENYTKSLENIFKERGYTYDFETIFIDAADYIEGTDENDDEFVQLSNFSSFISTLNSFVEKKGIIKKQFDTPIRLLKGSVSDIALGEVNPELQILLQQAESKIINSKNDLTRKVKLTINSCVQEIKSRGFEHTNLIGSCEEFEFKKSEEDFNSAISKIYNETQDSIAQLITEEEESLMREIESFSTKETVINFSDALDKKLESSSVSGNLRINLENQKKLLDLLSKGGKTIVTNTLKDGVSTTLRNVSGSNMHKVVLDVGHFFGTKFRPWEAVKLSSKIGKFAKFAGPILAVGGLLIDVYQECKEEQRREEIKKVKNQFFASVISFSGEREKELLSTFNEYIRSSFDNRLEEISQSKIELIDTNQTNTRFSEAIKKLDSEYVEFIEVLENS